MVKEGPWWWRRQQITKLASVYQVYWHRFTSPCFYMLITLFGMYYSIAKRGRYIVSGPQSMRTNMKYLTHTVIGWNPTCVICDIEQQNRHSWLQSLMFFSGLSIVIIIMVFTFFSPMRIELILWSLFSVSAWFPISNRKMRLGSFYTDMCCKPKWVGESGKCRALCHWLKFLSQGLWQSWPKKYKVVWEKPQSSFRWGLAL